MKKIAILLIVILKTSGYSQEKEEVKGVEKSLFNIQVGTFGAWFSNEYKLNKELVLRTEIGLNAARYNGTVSNNTETIFAPVINIEPRWYYNILKRESNFKKTVNNSANFVTAMVSYHPDWFTYSKVSNINVVNQIAIIPKWGIRRNLGYNFMFEAGLGLGYKINLYKNNSGYFKNRGESVVDLHLRIGKTF